MKPRILTRYLARNYVRTALATTFAIIAVVLVIDFADRAYSFRGEGWFRNMLRLYANLAIDLTYQVIPSALLVAAGITVSAFRATGELTAYYALGNRPARLIFTLLGTISIICLGVLLLHEWAVVGAARRADEIKATAFRRAGELRPYFEQVHWFRSGDWIYNLREREGDGFADVSLYELSDTFGLRRRIDADTMRPGDDGEWILEDARISTFDGGVRTQREVVGELALRLPERPDDFQLRTGKPRHLPLGELLRQIQLRHRMGLPDLEYRQEIYRRVMFPFSAVPASLVSIRLALRRRRRGHMGAALGEGILVSLLLWTLFTVFRAFGVGGAVSPAVSGIAPSAILLTIGLAMGVSHDLGRYRKIP